MLTIHKKIIVSMLISGKLDSMLKNITGEKENND